MSKVKDLTTKITDKELETIKAQQGKIQTVVYDLGALEAKKFEISVALKDFNDELNKTKKELEEKYGQVNINLQDGSYEEIVEEVSTADAK
tara:strand:+ start:324 stop:596 length:273 start_codon:yes stop_codon:yes gene_type:complete